MLLTLYYMYATLLQCWRISRTRAALAAASERAAAAVLLCHLDRCPNHADAEDRRILHNGNKLGCTVTPKKIICLESWLSYSSFGNCLPGGVSEHVPCQLGSSSFPVLIEADVSSVSNGDQMRLCELGQPLAWSVTERFQALLNTDLDHFSRLVSSFLTNDIAIHEGMQVLHMETVELEGAPNTLVHDKLAKKMRWPGPVLSHKQWRHLVEDLKSLCKKVNQASSSHNGAVCQPPEMKPSPKTHLSVTEHRQRPGAEKHKGERRAHKSSRRERSKETTPHKAHDRMKQSSSVDRLEARRESHRSKRERFAKRHSDDRLLDGPHNPPPAASSARRFKQEKPPNVLVCADSGDTRQNVTAALTAVLAADTYAVYDLGAAEVGHLLDSCTLAVVCGNVSPPLAAQLLQYLLDGGSLLCLCSDFLNTMLPTFTTAEVREHELVHFSYGRWQRVPIMHHIFCYQASPAVERFSQDSESHSAGNSPVAPRTPATVDIRHGGVTRTVHVQVLATEDTWHTPSILLAKVRAGQGRAVFSQVHLETDPARYQLEESKSAALRSGDAARLQILADILVTHLDIRCGEGATADAQPAPGYLLGRNQLKLKMLEQLLGSGVGEGVLSLAGGKLKLQFCGKDARPPQASAALLPVLVHACPDNFSTVRYFENLQTEQLGRLVLYCDTLGSSMDVISGATYPHGFTVVARRQTHGVGRAGNVWLSPEGCAMFSTQMHIGRDSALCGSLPLVQHAVAAAAVAAVRELPGYEHLDLGVKWPNDIYADSRVKLGGVVVSSVSLGAAGAICNVGIAVNLDNVRPTTCLNSLIRTHNEAHGTQLEPLHREQLVALVLTRLERMLDCAESGDLQPLYDTYYKYWLHRDSVVTVRTATQQLTDVQVAGIDQYGFLMVRAEDGSTSSVQPNGNSFDMLRGLIAPKLL